MKKRIFIYCRGCELRALDTKKFEKYFLANDYEIVNKPQNADIIVYVTCAFSESIEKNALENVRKFKQYGAELIVAGCLPKINKDKLEKIFNGKVISTDELDKDPRKVDELFSTNKMKFKDLKDTNFLFVNLDNNKLINVTRWALAQIKFFKTIYDTILEFILKNSFYEHADPYILNSQKLYFIRTSWGCLSNCSYCAIKRAIGQLHSKPIKECLNELDHALNKGYKKIILTADSIGAYGLDINSSLPVLLNKISEFPQNFTISLLGLSPKWAVKYEKELLELFRNDKRFINISIPIQSASSRILKLMNRYSNVENISEILKKFKTANPSLNLETNYILCFPTESFDDMKNTLSFITEIPFNDGIIYPFSCRPDTKAEKINPKISQNEILQRLEYSKNYLEKEEYNVLYFSNVPHIMFNKKYSSHYR